MVYGQHTIIVIDGYNVLRTCDKYKKFAGEFPNFKDWSSEVLNAAREALLNDVALMTDAKTKAIIVYDAAGREAPLHSKPKSIKNIDIVFSEAGQTADEAIQKIVFNARQKNIQIKVVTSDLTIQDSTMNKGVARMSSKEFAVYAQDSQNEVSRTKNTGEKLHATIEKRVDPNTAKKLLQLRDSLG